VHSRYWLLCVYVDEVIRRTKHGQEVGGRHENTFKYVHANCARDTTRVLLREIKINKQKHSEEPKGLPKTTCAVRGVLG
jgi:hypothetical protein